MVMIPQESAHREQEKSVRQGTTLLALDARRCDILSRTQVLYKQAPRYYGLLFWRGTPARASLIIFD